MTKDWVQWHSEYDDPGSALSKRRRQVTMLIRKSLDSATSERVRILSLCAGEARDLTDALRGHHRRADVSGGVVELNPQLAESARANLASIDANLEVVAGDAGDPGTFRHFLPVDLLLLVGIFGNIPDSDVEKTIRAVPMMGNDGATVVWTRHRRPPDLTPSVRQWFDEAGCIGLDFISPGAGQFAVGRERVVRTATDKLPAQLFRFQI